MVKRHIKILHITIIKAYAWICIYKSKPQEDIFTYQDGYHQKNKKINK